MTEHIIYMYENHSIKPTKTVYERKWGAGKEKVIVGVNLIRVHYVYTWKYHNETPC
jgi:hypothetical protein